MDRPLRYCLALTCLVASAAPVAWAQCPDGTPPPCRGARPRAATRVAPPAAAERGRRFLILPFRNVTRGGEQEWLIEGSTAILGEALSRWQGISVVSDERLYPALRRVGITPGQVADAPRVRRVAEETGGWTAVSGDVYAIAGKVRVAARAFDVVSGREVVRAASEVSVGTDVRVAYDSVGTVLLRAAGLDSGAVDVGDATTRSLDAFRAYTRGLAHLRRSEVRSAQEAFQEAVRLDSAFALAWARLAEVTLSSDVMSIFNPQSEGARYSARAVALSSRLPPRHRQLVLAGDASRRMQTTEVRRILSALLAADSNDVDALERMVGLESFDPVLVSARGGQRPRGSLAAAARFAERAIERDPARHSNYAAIAGLYANAGLPGGTPAIGLEREAGSVAEVMQAIQRREFRAYYPVLRDTIELVPAESLAAIPRDSLQSMRRRARAIGRAWVQRWVAVAPGEAAARQLSAELLAMDGEYPEALREVAVAESLGIQMPTWTPQARRLRFLASAGRLAEADRLADSLTSARFFANPNAIALNSDAAMWSWMLHLRSGRVEQAAALLDAAASLYRLTAPSVPPLFTAFQVLMGNSEPDDEPRIPRAVRAEVLDSLLLRLAALAASDRLGPFAPVLLPALAEYADQRRARVPALLRAADSLAAGGRAALAFQLAHNAIESDSAAESAVAGRPWYRAGADTLRAVRLAVQSRFHPGTATVTSDRAVFEWRVDDTAPFAWNQAATPPGSLEYRWQVELASGGRYYRLNAAVMPVMPGSTPASGSLTAMLGPGALRSVFTGAVNASGVQTDTTVLQGVTLRTEPAPGILRLVVTDRGVLDFLRRERPAQARFRFRPCARPVGAPAECVDERIAVSYP